jgi:hypothetical protein
MRRLAERTLSKSPKQYLVGAVCSQARRRSVAFLEPLLYSLVTYWVCESIEIQSSLVHHVVLRYAEIRRNRMNASIEGLTLCDIASVSRSLTHKSRAALSSCLELKPSRLTRMVCRRRNLLPSSSGQPGRDQVGRQKWNPSQERSQRRVGVMAP